MLYLISGGLYIVLHVAKWKSFLLNQYSKVMKIIAIYFVIGRVKVTVTKGGPYLSKCYILETDIYPNDFKDYHLCE